MRSQHAQLRAAPRKAKIKMELRDFCKLLAWDVSQLGLGYRRHHDGCANETMGTQRRPCLDAGGNARRDDHAGIGLVVSLGLRRTGRRGPHRRIGCRHARRRGGPPLLLLRPATCLLLRSARLRSLSLWRAGISRKMRSRLPPRSARHSVLAELSFGRFSHKYPKRLASDAYGPFCHLPGGKGHSGFASMILKASKARPFRKTVSFIRFMLTAFHRPPLRC